MARAGGVPRGSRPRGAPGQAAYFVEYYQPGDRFWASQSIEWATLTVLALLILGFAVYWTARRVR